MSSLVILYGTKVFGQINISISSFLLKGFLELKVLKFHFNLIFSWLNLRDVS
jgi:hypothetical protein